MAAPFMPFIQSITPRGLLSFGPDTPPLELRPLNVLIGPNGSGKSNLLDVIRVVKSMPGDMQGAIHKGGGMDAWIWNGATLNPDPSLELTVQQVSRPGFFRHRLVFLKDLLPSRGPLQSEEIMQSPLVRGRRGTPSEYKTLYRADMLKREFQLLANGNLIDIPWRDLEMPYQSALAQFRSFRDYPGITGMASRYARIQIYDAWESGRGSAIRTPQPADGRGDILDERHYSNLGLFLNQTFGTAPASKRKVIEGLRELYPRFTDYEVVVRGGLAQLFFTEGDISIPATRLSDGTLRYLCLLAILHNPKPPPLVCLEEPELGLHPDIVAGLAKHLQAASERMQVIVTTHSDILVDTLSDTPESIVVFENDDGATRMKRLDAEELRVWLEDYRLGELWTSGQIGGVRW